MFKHILVTAISSFLFFAPPAFAISLSGSASLDWSALTMTGIDFTLSDFRQVVSANVGSQTGFVSAVTDPNAWLPSTVSASRPSVGGSTANISDTSVSGSLSLFSNYAFASGGAARWATITALTPGLLTITIPYQIQNHGPISGEWFSLTSASIQFTNLDFTGGISDGASFEHTNASLNASGATMTGIASLIIPFIQGQTGLLNFDTRVSASVPEPEPFLLIGVGLIGLALWHQRSLRTRVPSSL
jgi:PEP-CTERM motif